jgi:hypothetical protein
MIENTCDPNQKSVFGLSRVNGNDADLTIHAQDRRVGRINRKCVRHIELLSLAYRIAIRAARNSASKCSPTLLSFATAASIAFCAEGR